MPILFKQIQHIEIKEENKRAWGACLVPRTGRRGAIYWQARTVPVNFR